MYCCKYKTNCSCSFAEDDEHFVEREYIFCRDINSYVTLLPKCGEKRLHWFIISLLTVTLTMREERRHGSGIVRGAKTLPKIPDLPLFCTKGRLALLVVALD